MQKIIYPSDIEVGIYSFLILKPGNEILVNASCKVLIDRVFKRLLVIVKATVLLQ